MPQVTLTISKNINLDLIDCKQCFQQIHEALSTVPDLNVQTIHSGVIQESFSYIGFDDPQATKVYLQLYWLENEDRIALQGVLGKKLLHILESTVVPKVKAQGFYCIPRVRIANLGELHHSYFIGEKRFVQK